MTEEHRVEALRREVVAALEAASMQRPPEARQPDDKNEAFISYGLSTPMVHRILRQFRQPFKELSLAQRLALAGGFFKSGSGAQASAAILLLSLSTREMKPEHLEMLDRFLDDFHSWGTTDDFCINVLQSLLHRHPLPVLALLEKWTHAENRWKRRASVVAFTRKVGASGRFTAECLRLCENLVWDRDDLVQKGVGWALKDNLRGDKARVLPYVKELRRRGVPATITLYAIRDLKGDERREVLMIRSEARPTAAGKG